MIYIYLAKRDKQGIKTIGGFKSSKKIYPTKISDIKNLNLRPDLYEKVKEESYKNRMNYELYVESADSFDELKNSLKKRGYKNLPMHQFTEHVSFSTITSNELITKKSTMLRRNSDVKK